jgi:hypothetical protein
MVEDAEERHTGTRIIALLKAAHAQTPGCGRIIACSEGMHVLFLMLDSN